MTSQTLLGPTELDTESLKGQKSLDSIVSTDVGDCLTLIGNDYVYKAVNEAYCTAQGKKAGDIIGRPVTDIWGESPFKKSIKESLDACFQGKEIHYQHWLEFPGSGVRFYDVSYYPYQNSTDGANHAVVVSRDITRQAKFEDEYSRMLAVIDRAGECVVMTDEFGNVLCANPAFEEISGRTDSQVVCVPVWDLFRRDKSHDFRGIFKTCLKHGQTWDGFLPLEVSAGQLSEVETRVSPVRNPSGKVTGLVLVMRDLTHERELEKQLHHSQRVETIGRLAGGIAHDFNNLLQVILSYTEMLQLDSDKSSKAYHWLEQVLKSADKASDLSRQLLIFSRQTDAEKAPLDIGPLLNETLKLAEGTLPPNINLCYRLSPDLPNITADPTQIHQVLLNLLVNARDAMTEGGEIRICADVADLRERKANGQPSRPGGKYIVLTVSDSGSGIPPEVRDEVFKPYFTTKSKENGTGLGLATTAAIAKQHGGFVDFQTEVGKGTSFHVYLPLTNGNTRGRFSCK